MFLPWRPHRLTENLTGLLKRAGLGQATPSHRRLVCRSIELLQELEDRVVPTLLGQQLFPLDNPWNQNISNAPVAANSAAIESNLQALWNTPPTPKQVKVEHQNNVGLALGWLMVAGGAMVGSLFSSDAWNNVTFAAGEVKNPRRTLPLALICGTLSTKDTAAFLAHFKGLVREVVAVPIPGEHVARPAAEVADFARQIRITLQVFVQRRAFATTETLGKFLGKQIELLVFLGRLRVHITFPPGRQACRREHP